MPKCEIILFHTKNIVYNEIKFFSCMRENKQNQTHSKKIITTNEENYCILCIFINSKLITENK